MAQNTETLTSELYDLLKVRGYKPVPLDAKNNRVNASQQADVIEFTFTKDGKDYGKAWINVDTKNIKIYYDERQQDSPEGKTPGVDYDDSWSGLLEFLSQWAQTKEKGIDLANGDRLGDDMRQRDYYKMKEKLGESYHPINKKTSYNDAVPNVKVILQHSRNLEEGEARFRNVARIFLENQDGERFLAPTAKPGLARVYARHIAEGGLPNDDRWNHIKSLCEDFSKMAGFVRATKNKEFNESALQLVNEGINHYASIKESLHKMTTHRGYHSYFESYSPPLMEDELDESIANLFVQENIDPRIEEAMPILAKLKKPVTEMEEVDTLAEWADSIISEKLELDEGSSDEPKHPEHDEKDDKDYDDAEDLTEMEKDLHQGSRHDPRKGPAGPDKTAKMMAAKQAMKAARKTLDKAFKGDVEENFIGMAPQAVAEEEVEEGKLGKAVAGAALAATLGAGGMMAKGAYDYHKKDPAVGMSKYDMDKMAGRDFTKEEEVEESGLQAYLGKKKYGEKGMKALQQAGRDGASKEKMATIRAKHDKLDEVEMEEGLDKNQKRAGQLGPIGGPAKVGDLVGANESTEFTDELSRIIDISKFNR